MKSTIIRNERVALRRTSGETDLNFVVSAERDEANRPYITLTARRNLCDFSVDFALGLLGQMLFVGSQHNAGANRLGRTRAVMDWRPSIC